MTVSAAWWMLLQIVSIAHESYTVYIQLTRNVSLSLKEYLLLHPILGHVLKFQSKLVLCTSQRVEKCEVTGERVLCLPLQCCVHHLLTSTPSYYFCHMTRASDRTTHE